ncbi:MAG: MFS transporter [Alphaproteobacteria bacterium]|nr:MFS transporter [Alphaproteobacteria bacterium]
MQRQIKASVSTPLWAITLAAASIAAIGMGIRQVMGLYYVPVSDALGLGRESFALAIAIANLVWGISAPVTGAVSDKYGTGIVVVFGALTTIAGLLLMYAAQSEIDLYLAGVFLGFGVAGAGVNAVVGAVGRAAAPEERSAAIAWIGMGAGIGFLVALPYAHLLMTEFGWQTSLLLLASTASLILLLAWPVSGRPEQLSGHAASQSLWAAVSEAAKHPSFWLLNAGFFVCGFHVIFYATHLPAYVADQGLGAEVGVWGLMAVGLGNLAGTYLAGQWGRYYSKRIGLTLIYSLRSLVFLGFLLLPITPATVIFLSGALGILWLSTVPLTSSLVATFFGAKWMTMLYGIVFFSHQLGSFLGAWMGGAIYDRLQSYDAMWWICVVLGVVASILHWPIVEQPVARPVTEAAR